MFGSLTKAALLAATFSSVTFAQTYTTCNPLKTTCPADVGLADGTFTTDFRNAGSLPKGWSFVNQGNVTFDGNGANIVMNKQGDSPIIQTDFYFLFGSFEAKVKAGTGQGIVSSIVLLSDVLDEVDWEFTGTNTGQVQSNYFGKGDDSTFDRAAWHAVPTPQTTYHTYKVIWTPEIVTWYIDGVAVRTLTFAAAAGGTRFPQTPMRVKIGLWAGGDPTNSDGTIQWAGGKTDFAQLPFSMSVQSVTVINYTPAKSYSYSDNSGTYQKIAISGGTLLSNVDGKAGAASTLSATTSLSKATPVPTNVVNAANVTRNATTTTVASQTLRPTTSATGAVATQSGSSANGFFEASSVTRASTIAFGGLAFFMALFV